MKIIDLTIVKKTIELDEDTKLQYTKDDKTITIELYNGEEWIKVIEKDIKESSNLRSFFSACANLFEEVKTIKRATHKRKIPELTPVV